MGTHPPRLHSGAKNRICGYVTKLLILGIDFSFTVLAIAITLLVGDSFNRVPYSKIHPDRHLVLATVSPGGFCAFRLI